MIAFTVPLQFTASIFGFLARDGVAASGMGLLSGSWLAVGLVLLTSQPGSTSNALGLFLVMAMLAIWAPASAALSAKLVPAVILATAGLRFGLMGIYQLSAAEVWEDAASIVGLNPQRACRLRSLRSGIRRRPQAGGAPTRAPRQRTGRNPRIVHAQQIADVHQEAGMRNQP